MKQVKRFWILSAVLGLLAAAPAVRADELPEKYKTSVTSNATENAAKKLATSHARVTLRRWRRSSNSVAARAASTLPVTRACTPSQAS